MNTDLPIMNFNLLCIILNFIWKIDSFFCCEIRNFFLLVWVERTTPTKYDLFFCSNWMSLGGGITEFLCQQASANWCNFKWLSAPPSDTTSNSFINWLWKFGIKASFLSGWENMVQIYWREFLNETKNYQNLTSVDWIECS